MTAYDQVAKITEDVDRKSVDRVTSGQWTDGVCGWGRFVRDNGIVNEMNEAL